MVPAGFKLQSKYLAWVNGIKSSRYNDQSKYQIRCKVRTHALMMVDVETWQPFRATAFSAHFCHGMGKYTIYVGTGHVCGVR